MIEIQLRISFVRERTCVGTTMIGMNARPRKVIHSLTRTRFVSKFVHLPVDTHLTPILLGHIEGGHTPLHILDTNIPKFSMISINIGETRFNVGLGEQRSRQARSIVNILRQVFLCAVLRERKR